MFRSAGRIYPQAISDLRSYFWQGRRLKSTASSLPQIESCPSPTCSCRPMPEGLDIERDKPLAGTIAAYHEQVVVCTGRSDWPSKIEDDESLPLVQGLKKYLGGKGKFFNPFHNVLITASSFPSTSAQESTALLFPTFTQVRLPSVSPDAAQNLEKFVKGFILAAELDWRLPTPPPNPADLVRDLSLSSALPSQPINDIVVLICGHGARDSRCGIIAPILQAEFEEKLASAGYSTTQQITESSRPGSSALIGAISHIGGHKYAGNVIIYIPPTITNHPLAGCGIWYGRVEPKHVEGLVVKTVDEGVIIHELFRGGIDGARRPIFL